MSSMMWLLSAFFLPLFPLSMGFNAVFARLRHPLLRTAMLLIWPQIGVVALSLVTTPIPEWVLALAVTTSILYGVRALALRELGLWTSFLATSSWTLLWIPAYDGADVATLHLYAAGFSVPLVLMALLTGGLERRFGAAYTGLYGGLAQVLPRFSGELVFVVPAVFARLATFVTAVPAAPAGAAGVAVSWLVWSWAGARLLQGMIVGPGRDCAVRDLSRAATWGYASVLVLLVVAGLAWLGGLS